MKIQIEAGGRTTDQIHRYIFALYIKSLHPGAEIVNYTNDEWQIKTPTADFDMSQAVIFTRDNHHDFEEMLADNPKFVSIQWPPLNHHFVKFAQSTLLEHLAALNITHTGEHEIGDDELLAHVRMGDIVNYVHDDFWPMPISWYAQIAKRENKRLVFMGEIFKHPDYFEKIQKIIPDCRMLPPGSVIEDFVRLQTAKNIIISVSSFSWLAGSLSQHAKNIHVPHCGFFSKLRRPDMDLFDKNSTRFHFHVMPDLNWTTVYNVMDYNLRLSGKSTQITPRVTVWKFTDPRTDNRFFKRISKIAKRFRKLF